MCRATAHPYTCMHFPFPPCRVVSPLGRVQKACPVGEMDGCMYCACLPVCFLACSPVRLPLVVLELACQTVRLFPHSCTSDCLLMHIHTHTHTHVYAHTHTHVYVHTYTHAYVHTYTHTHTYIHFHLVTFNPSAKPSTSIDLVRVGLRHGRLQGYESRTSVAVEALPVPTWT